MLICLVKKFSLLLNLWLATWQWLNGTINHHADTANNGDHTHQIPIPNVENKCLML